MASLIVFRNATFNKFFSSEMMKTYLISTYKKMKCSVKFYQEMSVFLAKFWKSDLLHLLSLNSRKTKK